MHSKELSECLGEGKQSEANCWTISLSYTH